MNILIVASTVYSPSDVSGGDRIFLELAKRWSKNNNVVIYGNHSTGAMCHAYGVGHLFKSIGEVGGILLSNRMFSYLAYTIKTVMKIHSDIEQYDRKNTIIYSSSDFWPDSIPAYYASVFHSYIWVSGFFLVAPDIFLKYGVHRGVKRFVTLFYKISQYLVIKMILSKSSLLITCSEDVIKVINIQNYLMYGGVTINKHVLQLREKIVQTPEYDVVFMGRFHPQKGPIEMVNIWHEVLKIDRSLRLCMIGNGPLFLKVKNEMERLGIDRKIDLVGFADGDKKNNIFLNSRLFAHPVIYDTGGMAAIEAMVLGVPAISFDLPGLQDVYPIGMHKIEKYDFEKFAKAIVSILNDKRYYTQLKSEAIELSNKWNWDNHAVNLENEFLGLIEPEFVS